jgi:hypothetical protein
MKTFKEINVSNGEYTIDFHFEIINGKQQKNPFQAFTRIANVSPLVNGALSKSHERWQIKNNFALLSISYKEGNNKYLHQL